MRWALKVRAEKRKSSARSGMKVWEKCGLPGAVNSQLVILVEEAKTHDLGI
jgi:hypothetical protein